jgi:shikimate kinase
MELILIGFMGSGKTTVSRLLGEMLNTPVTDLDVEIVRRAGMPIRGHLCPKRRAILPSAGT